MISKQYLEILPVLINFLAKGISANSLMQSMLCTVQDSLHWASRKAANFIPWTCLHMLKFVFRCLQLKVPCQIVGERNPFCHTSREEERLEEHFLPLGKMGFQNPILHYLIQRNIGKYCLKKFWLMKDASRAK